MMTDYEAKALDQLNLWQQRMQKKPSVLNRIAKSIQGKINAIIPEKVHTVITDIIEKMVKAVIFGVKYTTSINWLVMHPYN